MPGRKRRRQRILWRSAELDSGRACTRLQPQQNAMVGTSAPCLDYAAWFLGSCASYDCKKRRKKIQKKLTVERNQTQRLWRQRMHILVKSRLLTEQKNLWPRSLQRILLSKIDNLLVIPIHFRVCNRSHMTHDQGKQGNSYPSNNNSNFQQLKKVKAFVIFCMVNKRTTTNRHDLLCQRNVSWEYVPFVQKVSDIIVFCQISLAGLILHSTKTSIFVSSL